MYVQVISELNAQVLGSVSLSLSYFFSPFGCPQSPYCGHFRSF